MKLLLNIAGYGLLICALIHGSTHFMEHTPANDQEKEMIHLLTTLKSEGWGMLDRTMMDFFKLFNWSYTVFSFMLGVFTIMLANTDLPTATRKRFLVINFIFFTVLMALNLRYGILIPLFLYGFCWLVYALGILVWPKQAA